MRTLFHMLVPFRLRQWGRRLLGLPTVEEIAAARTAAVIQAAVPYAMQVTRVYLSWIPGAPQSLARMRMLELGPGRDFTPALILAGYGADVTLADLYLEPWIPDYHPAFYQAVRAAIRRRHPDWPLPALDEVIARSEHGRGPLRTLHCGLEQLAGVPDQSFDLTISNAVFEHLYDVPQALRELYRVTKPGGIGCHQVDFRDHRDFARPLEFLCEADYLRRVDRDSTDQGNNLRPHEMGQLLLETGFQVEEFACNLSADPAYLADVRPRLADRFRHFADEQLQPVSGRFLIRRPH